MTYFRFPFFSFPCFFPFLLFFGANTWGAGVEKMSVSSPVNAAASGEIDDIISINEMRARICSALLMLSAKGNASLVARRKVLPL